MIDTHTHVIATDTKKYPLAPLFGRQSAWSAEHPLDYPDMIKAIDAAGVDKADPGAGLVGLCVRQHLREQRRSRRIPKRFTGVFSVDVVAPDAVAKMKHWMSKGLTGMRIFTAGSTQPEQQTFFAERGRVSRLAIRQPTTACRSACRCRSEALPLLATLMERFPKVRVILDHFARASRPPTARRTPRPRRCSRWRNIPISISS